MTDLHKRAQRLYFRLGAATLFFVAFLAMNVNAILIGPEAHNWGLLSLGPLALAYAALPRRIPTLKVDAQTPPDPDMALRLDRLIRMTQALRAIFLILALFTLLVLPRLIPTPT